MFWLIYGVSKQGINCDRFWRKPKDKAIAMQVSLVSLVKAGWNFILYKVLYKLNKSAVLYGIEIGSFPYFSVVPSNEKKNLPWRRRFSIWDNRSLSKLASAIRFVKSILSFFSSENNHQKLISVIETERETGQKLEAWLLLLVWTFALFKTLSQSTLVHLKGHKLSLHHD